MGYSSYWKDAYKLHKLFDEKLAELDYKTINQITDKYVQMIKPLDNKISELSKLTNLYPDDIRRLEIYKQYVKELNERMNLFGKDAYTLVSKQQQVFIELAVKHCQTTINLIDVPFQKLNVKALDWMIGNSIKGGRLYDLLIKSYPDNVDNITKTLMESVLIGRNPRATERLIREDMAGNLTRALRISRTETISAYREASRQQMITSGLVNEWERIEQDDACSECQSLNGQRFPIDTVFEAHPNCRGTMLPVLV